MKKFFGLSKKKLPKLPEGWRRFGSRAHSQQDWTFLVAFFFILIIATCAFNLYIYYGMSEGNIFRTENGSEFADVEALNRAELTDALETINQRQVFFNDLRTTRPNVPTPF